MTTKPHPAQPTAGRLPPMPDPPREGDMQEGLHFDVLGEAALLSLHFAAYPRYPESTSLVATRAYLCRHRDDLQRPGLAPYPDVMVAFEVDAAAIDANNGYEISQVGHPPVLALEVASPTTGVNDYTTKRDLYARLGVPEYWRFDYTGGQYHDAPLGGDRLTSEGGYRPIELHTDPDGVIWGYSEALELSLCWVPGELSYGRLRFWNRATGSYLLDLAEERDGRLSAEDRANAERDARLAEREARIAAEAQANAKRDALNTAEARIRQLEEELRRRESP